MPKKIPDVPLSVSFSQLSAVKKRHDLWWASQTNCGPSYFVRALVRIEMLYVGSTHIVFMRNLDSLAPMFIEYR